MATVFLSPLGGVGAQFFTDGGSPLSGGKLYTYAGGTTTPIATYTSSTAFLNAAKTPVKKMGVPWNQGTASYIPKILK